MSAAEIFIQNQKQKKMNIECAEINLTIDLCLKKGNSPKEVIERWTKTNKVIYMKNALDKELKAEIDGIIKKLRYRNFDGSIHYPADEGYICDEHGIAILFPIKNKSFYL